MQCSINTHNGVGHLHRLQRGLCVDPVQRCKPSFNHTMITTALAPEPRTIITGCLPLKHVYSDLFSMNFRWGQRWTTVPVKFTNIASIIQNLLLLKLCTFNKVASKTNQGVHWRSNWCNSSQGQCWTACGWLHIYLILTFFFFKFLIIFFTDFDNILLLLLQITFTLEHHGKTHLFLCQMEYFRCFLTTNPVSLQISAAMW